MDMRARSSSPQGGWLQVELERALTVCLPEVEYAKTSEVQVKMRRRWRMHRAIFTCLGVAIALAMFGNCLSMPCASKKWMDDGYGGKIWIWRSGDNPDCNATSNGERKE